MFICASSRYSRRKIRTATATLSLQCTGPARQSIPGSACNSSRYDLNGNPLTADQAHPNPLLPSASIFFRGGVVGVLVCALFCADPAWGADQDESVVRRPQVARCKSSPPRSRSTSPHICIAECPCLCTCPKTNVAATRSLGGICPNQMS